MYSIILTPDELVYLAQMLKVSFGASSPLQDLNKVKLTAAKKKKAHENLLKGKAIVADEATRAEHVHTLAAAALGILSSPQSMIDVVITVPGGLQRRAFLGYKHTLLEMINTTKGTYIINLPITEKLLRDFLGQHLRIREVCSGSLKLIGPEVIVMALLWRLSARHPKGATAEQVMKAAAKKEYTALAYQGTFGSLTAEIASITMASLQAKGAISETEGKYLPAGLAALIGQAVARERTMLITRIDIQDDKPSMRTLSLVQGDGQIFVQTVTPGTTPVLEFTPASAATAVGLVSLAVFSADEFAREQSMPAPVIDPKTPAPPIPIPIPTTERVFSPTIAASAKEGQPAILENNEPAAPEKEPPVAPAPKEKPEPKPEPPAPAAPETKKCPACQADIPTAAKFCRSCGMSLASDDTVGASTETPAAVPVCSKCKAELKIGAKFCRACGTSVATDSAISQEVKL